MFVNPQTFGNLANSAEKYCGPLLDTMVPGIAWRAKSTVRRLITS